MISVVMLLRKILFDKDNIINWDKAFCSLQEHMSELRMFDIEEEK